MLFVIIVSRYWLSYFLFIFRRNIFSVIGIVRFCVVIYELGGITDMLAIAGNLYGYNVDISRNFSAVGIMCLAMTGFLFGAAICLISCR